MIDKEKNNARYRLSHCVNVLFSVDHGTFRWRREDKSRGLFTKIQGQTDIDSRFGQIVSKIHDWQISSFNLVHHLHKSNPFSQKTATKAWNWYQRWLRWNGTGISAWNIWNTKTLPFLFRNSVAHRSFFNWNDLKSHVPFACQLDFLETFCIW